MSVEAGQLKEHGPLGWRLTEAGREIGRTLFADLLQPGCDIRNFEASRREQGETHELIATIVFGINEGDHDRELVLDPTHFQALREPLARLVLTTMAELTDLNRQAKTGAEVVSLPRGNQVLAQAA